MKHFLPGLESTGFRAFNCFFVLLIAVRRYITYSSDGNEIPVGRTFIMAPESGNAFKRSQDSDFGGTVNSSDPNLDPECDRSGWTVWTQSFDIFSTMQTIASNGRNILEFSSRTEFGSKRPRGRIQALRPQNPPFLQRKSCENGGFLL